MYNYLTLSVLGGGNFEPSKLVSSMDVYIKGRILAFFRRWYSPFSCFQISSFSEEQMQGNEEKITKKGFLMRFFSAATGIFSFQIDTISPYYNRNR